ncbi:hypothetical protein U27_06440 [Candidatus Vecturithrix granuli]|uniref:Uncharacterized protein n=1 Tax=Vecturithrix granuli TaxID=1499967 RepID=A0A081C4F0_VECG1|nr:hypothetical protein U27_06440 [Candidatus Vecturithrix granuli]
MNRRSPGTMKRQGFHITRDNKSVVVKCNDTESYGHALRSAQALLARPKQSLRTPKDVHNLVCQYI